MEHIAAAMIFGIGIGIIFTVILQRIQDDFKNKTLTNDDNNNKDEQEFDEYDPGFYSKAWFERNKEKEVDEDD